MYKRYFKRIFDITISFIVMIILLPMFLAVSFIVKFGIGTPILFSQKRPGKDGKIFTMYKFRSMSNECDENGCLLSDEKRLGTLGKGLRASSLDELPELWNIFKGDMSLVGPRPLLVKYLGYYNEKQKHRHDVRPGLTGYAQVHGRNAISWEEKFELDVKYVNSITFLGDLKIIIKTILIVLKREGISSETSATMEEFKGTKTE